MWKCVVARCTWRSATFCFLFTAVASTAEAQGIAGTFEQLQLLVRAGDTVSVTDETGREVTGKITGLSSSALVLVPTQRGKVVGARREWSEGDVTTIRQRRSDPLANGAAWGFLVGAGVIGTTVALTWEGGNDAAAAAAAIAVYSAVGAGIGVGVDALIKSPQVIYEPRSRSTATLAVSPVLTGKRSGVLVSWRF